MKWLFSAGFLLLSIIAIGQPNRSDAAFDSLMEKLSNKKSIGLAFPRFKASNEDGKINNEKLAGKVVLVNFWFESCAPCVAEFGALNELYKKLKDSANFEMISFTWEDKDVIKQVKKKYDLEFPVYSVAPDECRRLNQNSGYPTNIILNKEGKIVYMKTGGPIDKAIAGQYVMGTLLKKITKEL